MQEPDNEYKRHDTFVDQILEDEVAVHNESIYFPVNNPENYAYYLERALVEYLYYRGYDTGRSFGIPLTKFQIRNRIQKFIDDVLGSKVHQMFFKGDQRHKGMTKRARNTARKKRVWDRNLRAVAEVLKLLHGQKTQNALTEVISSAVQQKAKRVFSRVISAELSSESKDDVHYQTELVEITGVKQSFIKNNNPQIFTEAVSLLLSSLGKPVEKGAWDRSQSYLYTLGEILKLRMQRFDADEIAKGGKDGVINKKNDEIGALRSQSTDVVQKLQEASSQYSQLEANMKRNIPGFEEKLKLMQEQANEELAEDPDLFAVYTELDAERQRNAEDQINALKNEVRELKEHAAEVKGKLEQAQRGQANAAAQLIQKQGKVAGLGLNMDSRKNK